MGAADAGAHLSVSLTVADVIGGPLAAASIDERHGIASVIQ